MVPIKEASGQLVIGKVSPAQYDPGLVVERDTGPHGSGTLLRPVCVSGNRRAMFKCKNSLPKGIGYKV